MLEEIRTVDRVSEFLEHVQSKKKKLMGFGHRIYRNYDPRATIIRKIALEVFEVVGKDPLMDVAMALEQQALKHPYFTQRKLYPNVDFYSGLIYKAMGFPLDFFPVLFAIPRVAGWLAHWSEALDDPDAKIWRPRQIYTGHGRRHFIPIDHRQKLSQDMVKPIKHPFNRRSAVAQWEGKQLSKL
ncbi:hypothetical protein HMI54_014406 [Coelomomyces lativittatus]|nr:hypothetical protein HMI55_000762 [Coelomomyces lativittatus]KAJ1514216.1 hypothetical protein HMI54_014406 [Coelomomyces lativittatus]